MSGSGITIDKSYDPEATLALTTMAPGSREARDAKAIAFLKATGNDDLLTVLGLVDDDEAAGNPREVACPTCTAPPGARCQKQFQHGENKRYHAARYRVAGREKS